MMRGYKYGSRKGNSLWWVAALSVAGFFVCVGGAMLLRYVFPATPTALPNVPIYIYSSPTPPQTEAGNFGATLPAIVSSVTATPALASPTPLPTATSAWWGWLFPYSPPTASLPTPIQAVVVTATPQGSNFPAPPPQSTPNPNTCKNILYPARPGSQWTYYVYTPRRSGNVVMSVASVDARQAAVDVAELNSGATARSYAVCDGDVVLDFPLISGEKMLGRLINGEMKVDYISGVLAPNEAAFNASDWALSWNIQYRVYGSGMIQYNGSDFYFNLSPSNTQMTCQTLGAGSVSFESVTVAAGTFNALKVICRGEGQAFGTVNGSQVSGTITAQSTQWFAPNIGLLKLQSDYAYLNVFGVSLPITSSEAAGYIELQHYVIGN